MRTGKNQSRCASVAILIPAYEPDEKLLDLIAKLQGVFAYLVVVDDGSTRGQEIFTSLRGQVDALLVHAVNRGKGAALKTGFAWVRHHLPEVKGVVTADADGQHLLEDILRVAEAVSCHPGGLVLGVRQFEVRKMPFRSRWGNAWARIETRLATGIGILDTQTGLRGIPMGLMDRLLAIPGDRYEYEMNMLLDVRHHPAPPLQIPIQAVYLNGNKSSHFRPLRDSLLTQRVLLRGCLASLLRIFERRKDSSS